MSGFRIISTEDGSQSVLSESYNATYHSLHGALQESLHVFIEAGLRYVLSRKEVPRPIRIFELGFGTGLNAWLSALEAEKRQYHIHYTGIDAHPLPLEQADQLQYSDLTGEGKGHFRQLHHTQWQTSHQFHSHFKFRKIKGNFLTHPVEGPFDLIYYDAFGPGTQPELWDETALAKVASLAAPEAIFVTYCARGSVRRRLEALGFEMERLPGPAGKREMLRGKLKIES